MFQRVSYLPRSPASLLSTSSDSSASPHPQPLPHLGTLLFHGPVPPTTGLWYGIDFLRPDAPGLETDGKSFTRAFYSKYLEEEDLDLRLPSRAPSTEPAARPSRDGEAETTSEFYATESNFQVEVVLSNKVARRFKQLGRLREVGLEWAGVSRAWDAEDQRSGQAELEELGAQLSRLEVLNLSYSMLPTLAEAGRIASTASRCRSPGELQRQFETEAGRSSALTCLCSVQLKPLQTRPVADPVAWLRACDDPAAQQHPPFVARDPPRCPLTRQPRRAADRLQPHPYAQLFASFSARGTSPHHPHPRLQPLLFPRPPSSSFSFSGPGGAVTSTDQVAPPLAHVEPCLVLVRLDRGARRFLRDLLPGVVKPELRWKPSDGCLRSSSR
ncbi:SPOSA6832_01878, partial [Sporobolomyces salmonicolor]